MRSESIARMLFLLAAVVAIGGCDPVPKAEAGAVPDAIPDDVDTEVTTVPPSFAACVSEYRREVDRTNGDAGPLKCTEHHKNAHPNQKTTVDLITAIKHSQRSADLYLDRVLLPQLEKQLKEDGSTKGNEFSRKLRHFIASRRAADEELCEIVYDRYSEGTIGPVIYGSCSIRQRDALLEALVKFEDQLSLE